MASTIPAPLCDDIPFSPIRNMRSLDNDDASLWSIQVNVSSPNGREQVEAESLLRDQEDEEEGEEEYEEEEEEEKYEDEEEAEEDDCGVEEYSELCDGLNALCVEEKGVNENKPQGFMPPFMGKHTHFLYNSDDELEACEEISVVTSQSVSPSVTRLNGFRSPVGKHLRFLEGEAQGEEEEEEKGEKQEQKTIADCKVSGH